MFEVNLLKLFLIGLNMSFNSFAELMDIVDGKVISNLIRVCALYQPRRLKVTSRYDSEPGQLFVTLRLY